jgi:hypothetical protein
MALQGLAFTPMAWLSTTRWWGKCSSTNQDGASLNAAGINYQSIKLMQTLQKLQSRKQNMVNPND